MNILKRAGRKGSASPNKKPKSPREPGVQRRAIRELFSFTVREKRAILYLLPLFVVLSVLLATLNRPHFEKSFPQVADKVYDSLQAARQHARYAPRPGREPDGDVSAAAYAGDSSRGNVRDRRENRPGELFPFDPNTIDRAGLQRLGFSLRQAQGILNYRAAGKVFRKPGDFAGCYTVSDEIYARLSPYIVIGAEFSAGKTRPPAKKPDSGRLVGTVRDSTAYPSTAADSSECTPEATPEPANRREASVRPNINLNTADSALLVSVSGIGPLTAGRIVAYRTRLGGFARPEQLAEIQGMTEQNYGRIVQQIFTDTMEIQKIDINFADPKRLEDHPYLTASVRRKILKQRQLKGGWRTIGEMTEDKTLSPQEAGRLAPYLRFSTPETP